MSKAEGNGTLAYIRTLWVTVKCGVNAGFCAGIWHDLVGKYFKTVTWDTLIKTVRGQASGRPFRRSLQ